MYSLVKEVFYEYIRQGYDPIAFMREASARSYGAAAHEQPSELEQQVYRQQMERIRPR